MSTSISLSSDPVRVAPSGSVDASAIWSSGSTGDVMLTLYAPVAPASSASPVVAPYLVFPLPETPR
jgi:hypothetical protein